MDLFKNPFHILNASIHDSRRKIKELADERSLTIDSNECTEAYSELTNPRKRLSAEIAWLPDIKPQKTQELLKLIESSDNSFYQQISIGQFPSIVKANLVATYLNYSNNHNNLSELIAEISSVFDNFDPEEIIAIINKERLVSGFPEVSDISAVESEIQERRRYYRQVIKSALDNLYPKDLVNTITSTIEKTTNYGEKQSPILIDDLIDSYEVEAQVFFTKEEENIKILADRIRTATDEKQSSEELKNMVDQLITVVQNWGSVAKPIQISTKSRGLDHDSSNRVAGIVRDLLIYIFNKHGELDLSKKLTAVLQEVFAKVDKVIATITEDANALSEVEKMRASLEEKARQKAENWRKEITYEAKIKGEIADRILRISPEGIEWNDRIWELNSISKVRWGLIRHSEGESYRIVFGDHRDSDYVLLNNQEEIYVNFIDRLWRTVGFRLLTDHLEGFRDGKKYQFGSAFVSDCGVELKQPSSDELYFYRWNDLKVWNDAGCFVIGSKDDEDISVNLNYQKEDNIHILEIAVKTFFKKRKDSNLAQDKISCLLEE